MTMALPASRLAVGMTAEAVPAVRVRPAGMGNTCQSYIPSFIYEIAFVFVFISVFVFVFVLTGGSESDGDWVNKGSRSPRDGEEAASQSEDDKALWISANYFM